MKPIPVKIRKKVIKRDQGKCQLCGKPYENIHHIYGRKSFIPADLGMAQIKGNNNIDNLVCLCGECHTKVHRYMTSDEEKRKLIARIRRRRYED